MMTKIIKNVKVKTFVYETYDYSMFKLHPKNRKIRNDKVTNIKKSMSERDILNPILVNEDFEIIDGNHRFTARKEQGLPILFIIVENATQENGVIAMQKLNQTETKSNWSHEDYLELYINEGNEQYKIFKELVVNNNINFADLLNAIDVISESFIGEKDLFIKFDNGELLINDLNVIKDFLNELSLFDKFDFGKHTSFVRAFLRLYIADFYDKEYIRHRLDIMNNEIGLTWRKTSIVDHAELLAKKLYTSKQRNTLVTYDPNTDAYYMISETKGRKPKSKKIKSMID